MREALRLATVDFLLSEVALVTVECASVIVVDEGRGGVRGGIGVLVRMVVVKRQEGSRGSEAI